MTAEGRVPRTRGIQVITRPFARKRLLSVDRGSHVTRRFSTGHRGCQSSNLGQERATLGESQAERKSPMGPKY